MVRPFKLKIKNYTSSVPASQTIASIEAYLAECGVVGTTKEFEKGQPVALMFDIATGTMRFTIRLPANLNQVQEWLWKDYCKKTRNQRKTRDDFYEQAAKTAWSIQRDWVMVQMSLIQLKQAELAEVFLPFIWNGKRTFYNSIKEGDFKSVLQLGAPK